MKQRKIIAVVGATGTQGGGLVRSILREGSNDFTARAITRNVNSDKARELARLGAEIVAADVDNPDSLNKAFAGAHAAYCVTFFWEHFSPEKELAHATAMAKAAKHAGVQHLIWSTLEDTRKWVPLSDNRMPTLMGKYKVPHFDAKGEANQIFMDLKLPTTFMLTSFYWDNLISFGMGPKKNPDGTFAFTLPMGEKKLPGIAAEDIGRCAYGIFQEGGRIHRQDRRNSRRTPDRHSNGRCAEQSAGPGNTLQRCAAGSVSRLGISRRGRSRQHVPVQERFRAGLLWGTGCGVFPFAQPGAADFRGLAQA